VTAANATIEEALTAIRLPVIILAAAFSLALPGMAGAQEFPIQPGAPADGPGAAILPASPPAGGIPSEPRRESSLYATDPYVPPTGGERADWVVRRSLGWKSLATGTLNAGLQTWRNSPEDWGPGWSGFGKRLGTRQTESLMSHSLEAGLGALWGEDPRYFRSGQRGFGRRLKHAVLSTFLTYRRDGSRDLAWARFAAVPSARAITGLWRPDTQRDWWKLSAQPLGTGLSGKVASNILREFGPDLVRKLFGRERQPSGGKQ
jgi:hypothetical protein